MNDVGVGGGSKHERHEGGNTKDTKVKKEGHESEGGAL
jgi:hypothetical protein